MTQPTTTGTEPTLAEVLVGDPLSEVTRKTRLYLLAVSLIGLAMVRTGLVPTKIATFGIELEKPNRSALLFLIALVNLYFLAAFVIYAVSDFRKWRGQVQAARDSNTRALRFQLVGYMLGMSEDAVRKRYASTHIETTYFWSRPLSDWPDDEKRDLYSRGGTGFWDTLSPNWIIENASTDELFTLIEAAPNEVRIRTTLIEERTDYVTGALRGFFEFVLPIGVGLFGIGALLFRIFSV